MVYSKISSEFFLSGCLPNSADLLNKDDMVKIKRCLYALQRTGHPPVTTHNVVDDWNDPVLSSVRRCELFNTVHDRVKIVFHPEFLSSTNPLFGLDYEEFVRGCHLGVSNLGLYLDFSSKENDTFAFVFQRSSPLIMSPGAIHQPNVLSWVFQVSRPICPVSVVSCRSTLPIQNPTVFTSLIGDTLA